MLFARAGAGPSSVLKIPPGAIDHPRVSPDGQHLAFATVDDREAVVWTYELGGSTAARRLTFGGRNQFPIWSSDSQHVAFQSDRDGDAGIFWQRADGTGAAERLTRASKGTSHVPESWSPRDDGFLFRVIHETMHRLEFFSLRDKASTQFGGVESAAPTEATFSPDGRWVAYESGDSAGNSRGVYIQPYPATRAVYQVPIVESGGYPHPRWSHDGRELFYMIGGTVRLMAASVTTQPAFALGNPVRLGRTVGWIDSFADTATQWDVLPDGRFIGRTPIGVISENGGQAGPAGEIRVVLNWTEELKERVPVK
jgi:Tol biopolymer transport system component